MTAIVRQPYLAVYIDGQELTKRFSATCSLGFDLAVSEATVVVPELPSWGKPWSVVSIVMGATQATARERFRGFWIEADYTFYPRAISIICRGPLVRCQLVECSTSGGQDLSNNGAGQTDQQIIQTLLNAGGLTSPGPVDLHIGGLSRTLGTVATKYYAWAENQSALDMIQQIDQICLGYVTFDSLGGSVVRQQITVAAATTAALTFTEGVDIESATSQLTVLDTKTRSQVTGYDPGTGAFNYTLQQTNPLMPLGYVTEQLSSNLLESSTTGGTGISCQEVATWRLNEINRIIAKMPITTPRDDLIAPGMTIAIVSSYRLGVNQNFWVQRVDVTINEQGAFSQQMTVIGGVTGFGGGGGGGPLGPPSGGTTGSGGGTVGGGPGSGTGGGAGGGGTTGGGGPGTPPSNTPPTADFTLDLQEETVVISGAETTIWEVQANSTSTGTSAAISTYAWTATGGTPSSGSNDTFVTSYTSQPDGTKSISLTVTDANGNTATVTKAVPAPDPTSAQYLTRTLYLAGTDTIDDFNGTAWATQSESGTVTVANGPVWGNSPGYNAFYSTDDLATVHTSIPFPGGGTGSSVTALWMEREVAASRILAGAASGQLALSSDGGVTWTTVAGPEVLIIQKVVLSRYHPNQWFALTSAHLWRSDNAGAGWVVVQAVLAGETFVDFNLSFARGMICISGGSRGLIDLQGNVQTLPGGMGHPVAVTAHIRKDRFFCYDASGKTAYHNSDGGTMLVAGANLPAGASSPQTGGLWRDSKIVGLLYFAAGAGGVWKSVDGFGSSGGYYQLRKPGVGSSPGGAVYVQVGVDGTLTAGAKTPGYTLTSSIAAKAKTLWNGSGNNAPPTNWQDPTYVDSGWANAVVNTAPGGGAPNQVWPEASSLSSTEQALLRHHFTLPAGTITAVTLTYGGPRTLGIWINGVFVPGSAGNGSSSTTVALPPSLLLPGAANVLAYSLINTNAINGYAAFVYSLVVS